MEVLCSSETSVQILPTRRCIAEHGHIHTLHSFNSKIFFLAKNSFVLFYFSQHKATSLHTNPELARNSPSLWTITQNGAKLFDITRNGGTSVAGGPDVTTRLLSNGKTYEAQTAFPMYTVPYTSIN
jgi:hypothetical protein